MKNKLRNGNPIPKRIGKNLKREVTKCGKISIRLLKTQKKHFSILCKKEVI